LKYSFNLPDDELWQMLEHIPIVHVYGQLATLVPKKVPSIHVEVTETTVGIAAAVSSHS